MKIKNLLNYIAIEIEAGRLTENSTVHVYDETENEFFPCRKVEANDMELEIIF